MRVFTCFVIKKIEIRHVISDKRVVQYFVALCKSAGIRQVVFSPGSRNAPLVLSFVQDDYFQCKSIVDERSAAFVALGLSIATNEPVMICCTSGSASLNYAPAIAEAYYQKMPLLVVTADRPQRWIDNGEGQAIRQIDVYQNYCKAGFHLNDTDIDVHIEKTLSEMGHTIFEGQKGPVHLNLSFEEPLYQTISKSDVELSFTLSKNSNKNIQVSEELLEKWKCCERILIICGQMTPNTSLKYVLQELQQDQRIVVLTESTSNMQHPSFVNCIDRTLERIPREEAYQPQLVITLGDAIVSKKIKTFLRNITTLEHWIVQPNAQAVDVFSCLTEVIDAEEANFLKQLFLQGYDESRIDSGFQSKWRMQSYLAADYHESFLPDAPWSDLVVFDLLHQTLPERCHLHLANSSPIRYWQLFNGIESVHHYSNRGVSGIDGSSSTAVGVALINKSLNVLVTGDLSFVYDSHAFWNKYVPENLKVIVINNGGGGIFRIIPGPEQGEVLNDYFEVGNPASIKDICATYNMHYTMVNTKEGLAIELANFYTSKDRPHVLEVFTPNTVNPQVLKEYFNFVKQ
jgi:2-succinyl-5-enolpyruvyl-6-hydroxy-3-cyclohexene-1-carboxylate synthase